LFGRGMQFDLRRQFHEQKCRTCVLYWQDARSPIYRRRNLQPQ
jgi:hypothetical protein